MVDAQHIFAAYILWLLVFGTIGNILVILICIRLRKTKFFVFLAGIGLSDTFALGAWNLPMFLSVFFSIDFEGLNVYSCRVFSFVQYSSLQITSWMVVSSLN